jgi:hypothetical protein
MPFLRRIFGLSPLGLAIAGAIGPFLLSVISLAGELPNFVNPCMEWGTTGGRRVLDPASLVRCGGRMGGTSETRLGAAARLLLIQGGMLAACAAALVGAARYRLRSSVLAFAFMMLITVPLAIGSFGLVTLIAAICFGASAALVAWHVRGRADSLS